MTQSLPVQLCLLSGDLMPNVIGVLHRRATQVLPVVTRESVPQLETFQRALAAAGSRARLLDPVTVLPYDLRDCREALRDAVERVSRIEVNWTGGTKVMSYAARRLADDLRLPALYVDLAAREVLLEDLAREASTSEMFDSRRLGLNVLVHLAAAGHTVEGADGVAAFRKRCTPGRELVDAATLIMDARPGERSDLNRLAAAADQPYKPVRMGGDFLRVLVAASILQPAALSGAFFLSPETRLHPFHLQSPQNQNAMFLRGTYLEVFLWSQIKERSAVDDVAWHLVLNPGSRGRVAELDVALCSDGRFLALECKSHVDLAELSGVIEEQYARTRRIGKALGRWVLYVHRHRADYSARGADSIISSQEAKAADCEGRILWHDDLRDLPVTVAAFLSEARSVH